MLHIEKEISNMNIKYLFFIMGVVCACHTTPGYVIKGDLKHFSGKMFLMTLDTEQKVDTLISVEVKNGMFEMRGYVQEPIFAWLQADKGDFKIPFFLENMEFVLDADMSNPTIFELTGGRLQALREQFKKEVEDSIQAKRRVLCEEYKKSVEADSLFGVLTVRARMDNLDSLYDYKENLFIRENNNIVSVALVRGHLKELVRKKKLIQKFELLGDTARNSVIGRELKVYVERERRIAVGSIAPDFTLNTPDGKSLALHAVKARIKILDFWASWCGPCREENSTVKRLYDKYHNSDLEVVSVSLDMKKEAWVKAIEQDSLPWIHVSDLQGWECAAAKLYGVSGIPCIIVLDEDNRIIGTDLRGKELEEFIAKVLLK